MGLRVPPCRPWCGAFVHAAFRQAGIQLSARLIDPHRSYQDAVAGRRGLKRIPVKSVRRGDLLFMALQPGKLASHLAIARGAPVKGKMATVEGNVDHRVSLEKRSLRFFVLAARVVG
jgi:cell wall-associated NlpC family hydrolase